MKFIRQNGLICGLMIYTASLTASHTTILSDAFVEYHLKAAVEEVEDEELFYLIQENIENLTHVDLRDISANELNNLIIEGYKIDPFNMARLIELLKHTDASKTATKLIINAIEYHSMITADHMIALIQTLPHANASDHATKIILKAIESGVKFGLKERRYLTGVSRMANARKNVEKIREALHTREMST